MLLKLSGTGTGSSSTTGVQGVGVYSSSSIRKKTSLSASADESGDSRPISVVEDDGFSTTRRGLDRLKRLWNRIRRKQPGTLILIRHGESTMYGNNTFTGWLDPDLSEVGKEEMEHASRLLLERGIQVDLTYTSRLKRAIRSSWILLKECDQVFKPVYKSWRLNERSYGAMEGFSKPQLAMEIGEERVQEYRKSLFARPPPTSPGKPSYHRNERKYADLAPEQIPLTESVADCLARTIPLWRKRIEPELRNGRTVMIVAHANPLRGLIKHIEDLTPEETQKVILPNGIPLVYKFDRKMRPVLQQDAHSPLRGVFLENPKLLAQKIDAEKMWGREVPGYKKLDSLLTAKGQGSSPSDAATAAMMANPVVRTLTLLAKERKERAELDWDEMAADFDARSNTGATSDSGMSASSSSSSPFSSSSSPFDFASSASSSSSATTEKALDKWYSSQAFQDLLQQNANSSSEAQQLKSTIDDDVLVLIRHGKTEYNKLGIFTGWDDAPLAEEGRKEARRAGQLLKLHGVEFDIVYTSWLSRAIETAWAVLDELDCLWLPLIKSWRLNERMYGALTGSTSHTHIHTHTYTRACTYTHTHIHTHTHTHSHTQ